MRVGIICNSYPTTKNPYNQIFIKNLKENLEKHDLTVDVDVCYNKIFDLWGDANTYKGIFSNIIKYSFFLFSVIFFAFRKGRKIDVIFSHAVIFPTTVAVFLKKILGIPVVCYVHGGDINAYPTSSAFYKHIMRISLNESDYIIVNSRDMYEKVCRITDLKKVEIISPGVDTHVMKRLESNNVLREAFKIPSDKFFMLSAGNAIKRKGFDLFIKAVANLSSDILQNTYSVLLTEGPEKSKLLEMIYDYRLKDYMEVRDKVDHLTLNKYYNMADVFIFPSREEPLGLVGIEAMAAGTIVIGSKVGGIKEYISDGENGFLFEPEDHLALSQSIEKVYRNFDSFCSIRQEADKIVRAHSIEHSVERIYSIFATIHNRN